MSDQWIVGAIVSVLLALIGALYNQHQSAMKTQWAALDRKASAQNLLEAREQFQRALEQLRSDHLDRIREVQKDYAERLADLATRQDREVDALKSEMSRVTLSLSELRRDVTQGNINIMDRLQEMALMIRSSPH